jgi:hypothetical protein
MPLYQGKPRRVMNGINLASTHTLYCSHAGTAKEFVSSRLCRSVKTLSHDSASEL